jgi:hypothetical protein
MCKLYRDEKAQPGGRAFAVLCEASEEGIVLRELGEGMSEGLVGGPALAVRRREGRAGPGLLVAERAPVKRSETGG